MRLDPPRSATERAPGTDIFLELEILQPIGSFKIRGAHNVLRQLPGPALRDGISDGSIDLDAFVSLVAGSKGIDIGSPS